MIQSTYKGGAITRLRRTAGALVIATVCASVAPAAHAEGSDTRTGTRTCNATEVEYIKSFYGEGQDDAGSASSSAPGGQGGEAAWLTEGTPEYERAKQVYEYWTETIGTSGAFAAGVVANVRQESAGTFDPLIVEGGGRFKGQFSTEYDRAAGNAGGGLYQFTPFTKYSNSPLFKKYGWSIDGESEFVWISEFVTGTVAASMKSNASSLYGQATPFTRAYTVVPKTDGSGDFNVLLDPEALVTSNDPARAAKGFQIGYERPAQYHPEREDDARRANAVFNKNNFRGDREKLKKAIGAAGAVSAGLNALDTISQALQGNLSMKDKEKIEREQFNSPCRMPTGDVVRNAAEAKLFAAHQCGAAPKRNPRASRAADRSSTKEGNATILNSEQLKPNALALAKAVAQEFPEIETIGGWRPVDTYPDHPSGHAVDIMIPDFQSENGKKLGDAIKEYVWENQDAFDVTYTIWRQTYQSRTDSNVMEDRGGLTANHFDHVHVTVGDAEGSSAASARRADSINNGAQIMSGFSRRGILGVSCETASDADGFSSSGGGDLKTDSDVIVPVDGIFTSGYGPRWGTIHNGYDIAGNDNYPIYSAVTGTVVDAGPANGYGQWIRVKTDDGVIVEFGHIKKYYAQVGDKVKTGQHIADVNSGGSSTGPHLHIRVWLANGQPADPQKWFTANGAPLPTTVGAPVKAGQKTLDGKTD